MFPNQAHSHLARYSLLSFWRKQRIFSKISGDAQFDTTLARITLKQVLELHLQRFLLSLPSQEANRRLQVYLKLTTIAPLTLTRHF